MKKDSIDVEKERQERVKEYKDAMKGIVKRKDVDLKPGSFSFHEALHCSFLSYEFFSNTIMDHPSIFSNEDLYAQASEISTRMWDLYQKLGEMHLTDDKK